MAHLTRNLSQASGVYGTCRVVIRLQQLNWFACALIASPLAFVVGCVDEDDGGGTIGETGSPVWTEDPCYECAGKTWGCTCIDYANRYYFDTDKYFCWSGADLYAEQECAMLCWHEPQSDAFPLGCSVSGGSNACNSWAPASEVTYSTLYDTYTLDWGFIATLAQDPEPLLACDDATVVALNAGGFEIQGTNAGELLYELGLRDGDLIVSLNDYDLWDYNDVSAAFVDLWFNVGESSYTLEILRGTTVLELNYELVFTFL